MQLPDSDYVKLNCYYTWMGDDGIARTVVKEKAVIDLEEAIRNSKVVNGLSQNKFPLIVDNRKIKSISKEAREHFTVKGRDTQIISIAIIVDSSLSRMIANFFIGVSRPEIPVKIFNQTNLAIDWSASKNVIERQ